MLNAITHSQIWVLDQDEALDFYVGKLGFEVHTDAPLDFMRWLTINLPGQRDRELILMVPGPPALDPDTADAVRGLLGKGAGGAVIITTDDCRGTYETLRARASSSPRSPSSASTASTSACAIRSAIRCGSPSRRPWRPSRPRRRTATGASRVPAGVDVCAPTDPRRQGDR